MSRFDDIFIENCRRIIEEGYCSEREVVRARWADGSFAHTKKIFGLVNRYDLSQEFPAITLRKLAFKSCIKELLWIWQKKSNKIADLELNIWNEWAQDDGTIGKAYGYQLGKKDQYKEGMFDQVDRVLFDLKNQPYSRRIMTNMYNFSDLHDMALYPCAYSMTFNVTEDRLNAILHQRSNDMLTANHWNVAQYAILVHMFAQVSNLKVGELVHVIADAHLYDKHIPIVEELIKRPTFKAPKLWVNEKVKDFYEFTVDDFQLLDYEAHPNLRDLPVAI